MPALDRCADPACFMDGFLLIGDLAYCGAHAREANGGRL